MGDDRLEEAAEAAARRAWAARCAPSAPLMSEIVRDEAGEHLVPEQDVPALLDRATERLLQIMGRAEAAAA